MKAATQLWPVMDSSDAAAQATVDWIAEEVDRAATMNFLESAKRQSVSQTFGWGGAAEDEVDPWGGIGKDRFLRMAMGIGAHQLVGSYDSVAEQIRELHDAGISSVLMSFFDPLRGLHQMEDEILPRLRKMGLRR